MGFIAKTVRAAFQRWRWFALLALALACVSCSPFYVLRAGWEEASILMRREDIADMVQAPETDKELKRKLELVLAAREFAKQKGLEAGGSYTQYSKIDRDVLVWVLSASPKTSFDSYTWWFPVVGRVPYKGFFEKEDGLNEARKLAETGYDIYLRPSPAFSTLGWFDDPLLSTVVAFDDISLVNTVIHEILHNTVWIPNHVPFNETLANVVGALGAYEFFKERDGETTTLAVEAKNRWQDELLFARFLEGLEADLKTLYASYPKEEDDLSPENQKALLEKREERFRSFVELWKAKQGELLTKRYLKIDNLLNNAAIVAYKIYLDRPWLFVELYDSCQQSTPCLVAGIKEVKKRASDNNSKPYEVLELKLAELRNTPKIDDKRLKTLQPTATDPF